MSLQVRMLIASMALVAAVSGCDRGWQEFQRVELGKPMPADTMLRPQKAKDPNAAASADRPARNRFVWGDWGSWPVPISVGQHTVGVKTDAEGRVTAKSYRAFVYSNYLLFSVPAMRRVVELQVPPNVLLELGDEKRDPAYVRPEDCRTLRSYISNAMCEVDLSPKSDEDISEFWKCWWLGVSEVSIFGSCYSAAYGYHNLEESIRHLPLKGLTQQGYDRTFRPVLGGSIRVQNLGQGRIRVEMNLLRLYDPLLLMAGLYMPGDNAAMGE